MLPCILASDLSQHGVQHACCVTNACGRTRPHLWNPKARGMAEACVIVIKFLYLVLAQDCLDMPEAVSAGSSISMRIKQESLKM